MYSVSCSHDLTQNSEWTFSGKSIGQPCSCDCFNKSIENTSRDSNIDNGITAVLFFLGPGGSFCASNWCISCSCSSHPGCISSSSSSSCCCCCFGWRCSSSISLPDTHFVCPDTSPTAITIARGSILIVIMITTKALTPPLPSKILIPRLITLHMTIFRTITPPMHLMRKCPPPIPVYITSHVRSSVKSIRASGCCWIWCLGSL
mmetsp:Transcript_26711/g.40373  ORF Transcript_26711/g.40373 Transcript_26711/m.40373 type:complete len:204 (+) Transcript_26711:468-1079(+)